jgi:hypothetical protein
MYDWVTSSGYTTDMVLVNAGGIRGSFDGDITNGETFHFSVVVDFFLIEECDAVGDVQIVLPFVDNIAQVFFGK